MTKYKYPRFFPFYDKTVAFFSYFRVMTRKCYFISDAHLGALAFGDDRERERKLCRFLEWASRDATDLFLMGDIFDFWYEYRYVVPKGHVRLLGCLARIADSGVKIHYFIGNHDIWTYGYLAEEIGMTVYRDSVVTEINGYRCFLAHGDRTGYRSLPLRLTHAIFHSEAVRRLYNTLHPWLNFTFGLAWSRYNRKHKHTQDSARFLGEDKEYLVQFAKLYDKEHIDFFVFGHRHILLDLQLTSNRRVIYLGDWIDKFSYAVLDADGMRLELWEADETPGGSE